MKFGKSKKETAPVTILDKAETRLQEIHEAKRAANERDRAKILELNAEKDGLGKLKDEAAAIVEKLMPEYDVLIAAFHGEEAAAIGAAAITEDDLKAGRVSAQEFFKVGKQNSEIEAEATSRAEGRLAPVRDAIREKRRLIYEIVLKIRTAEEKIALAHQSTADSFLSSLDAMRLELRDKGAGGPQTEYSHNRTKAANNDLALTKGVSLFFPKIWTCKTIEDVERIPLDPILQEKHFGEFRKFLDSVRGLDFAEITIFYTPSEFPGRNAGEFWHNYRPKVIADSRMLQTHGGKL